MNHAADADTAPLRRCCRFACVVAALAAGALIAAAPHRARAQDSAQNSASADQCSAAAQFAARPPVNLTPLELRVLRPSIEPVPATDGLIHLPYAAQVTNTSRREAQILSVAAVDPLANFAPTGTNIEVDIDGNDVAAKVKRFGSPQAADPEPEPIPTFSTTVPGERGGLMFFDVTYTDPAQVPRLLSHAITVVYPTGTNKPIPELTDPVPVGCVPLAVLHPPLVGHGWTAANGCCTTAAYHRDNVPGVDGDLTSSETVAIDYIELGPNNSCCSGPPQELSNWWGYGTPVLAAAHGRVVEVVKDMLDQTTPGKITPVPTADLAGNHVIEDIGDGRFVMYAHLMPGSIPAGVKNGAVLQPGEQIGRVGSSGNSDAPHLHFQVMDSPSALDARGLPFVFNRQLLEGQAPEVGSDSEFDKILSGAPVPIDRTNTGLRTDLMPARNGVFGYNLSR